CPLAPSLFPDAPLFRSGFKRSAAAEFSFLLAMPAVFASGLYKLTDIGGDEYAGWGATITGTLVAAVVGYICVAWLMKFISTHSRSEEHTSELQSRENLV